LISNAATTELSTPPDKARKTFLSPTCLSNQFNLVGYEVFHIPVGRGLTGIEDKGF
jgi:hypothetical protein